MNQIDRALKIYSNPDINSDSKKKHLEWLLGRIGQPTIGEEPNIPGYSIPTIPQMRFDFSSAVNEILDTWGWEKFQKKANEWRATHGKRQGGTTPWTHRNERFFRSATARWTGTNHLNEPVPISGRVNEETATMFRDLLIEVREG